MNTAALVELEAALRALPETNAVHNAVNTLHELQRHLLWVVKENPPAAPQAGEPPAASAGARLSSAAADSPQAGEPPALPVAGSAPALPKRKPARESRAE